MKAPLDAIVIGGGHAGLCTSYFLKQNKLSHLVFERHRIGNSWRSQRWDSFKLNTPNNLSGLPGFEARHSDSEGFISAKEFVDMLEQYARDFELPVEENSQVLSVEKVSDSELFRVIVSRDGALRNFESRNVVVASGAHSRKIIPEHSGNVSPEIAQLHVADYRNADCMPKGAVLVVGSGQSGIQVAEDLLDSGREVIVSTSMVARAPRRYRGKDVMEWMNLTGFLDQRTDEITDPQVFSMKQPQISGIGPRGRTVSLQSLAAKGALILGKTTGFDRTLVHLQDNAADHVKFGDGFSKVVKGMVDDYIDKVKLDAPAPEIDEADKPDINTECATPHTLLNLKEHDISCIIWCTGFDGDFSYLKLPVFNEKGVLMHQEGISEIKGLYFVGFPWLRKRKSGIILGIEEDVDFIGQRIQNAELTA
jgi:putative flavoprotein involved in K+ transport